MNKKKLTLSIFAGYLLLAAFSSPAMAADGAGSGIFLDAKAGSVIGKPAGTGYSSETHTSWGADGGYLWKTDDANSFGFELGYMHFGNIAQSGGNSGVASDTANAMTVGGRYEHLFGEDQVWLVQLRAGLASMKVDGNFNSFFGPSGSSSWRENGPYVGFGVGRRITQGFSVLAVYSNFTANGDARNGQPDLDVNWIGLVAECRF